MNTAMNTSSQHEFHPDAECLNAFAEQALNERERNQVFQHLAVCPRCRQVVALSQKAALGMEEALNAEAASRAKKAFGMEAAFDVAASQLAAAPAASSAAAPPAARRAAIKPNAWWKSWRIAWIPAAALAAMVALAVFVHVRRVEQNAEMAKLAEQNLTQHAMTAANRPQPEEAVAAPAALAPEKPHARAKKSAPPAAAPMAAKSPARSDKREPSGTMHNLQSQEIVVTAAMPGENGGTEHVEGSREESASAPSAGGQGFAGEGSTPEQPMAAYTPAPAVTAWQQEQRQKAAVGAAPASVHGTNGGSGENRSAPMMASSQTPDVSASTPHSAAPTPSATIINPNGATKTIHLPSGLRVESMASAGPRMLAIDAAGALFLSEDSGDTWEHVTPQWTGRAVKVRRQMAGSGMEVVPTKFFELLNDQSQIWLSTDGRTWTAK